MLDWIQKLGSTRDHQELVSLTREYLANWYHGDLAQIAEECRPTRIRGVDDIHYWSERLAEGFCAAGVHGDRPDLHREMLAFFTEAGRRAGELPAHFSGREARTSAAPASPALPGHGPSR